MTAPSPADRQAAAEVLRERILADRRRSVEADLLDSLRELPYVRSAEATWGYGWVEIRVGLAEWTWEAHELPNALIDAFAREHVVAFSVVSRFLPPELTPPARAVSASGRPTPEGDQA